MHRSRLCFIVATLALAIAVSASRGQNGWTDLTPPSGAQVFYVSTIGSDSNPGTQAAPFRTIQRGYNALRDGQPDQVRLRCGDVWNESGMLHITKGAWNAGQYQVIGSYGSGPRPVINFIGTSTGFHGSARNKRGVAFVGLELVGTSINLTNGITMLSWHDILIEDCAIRNFSAGVVMQDAESTGLNFRVLGFKARRNVITDIRFVNAPDQARAQGIYMGGCDGWLLEGNFFDRCGIPGSIFGRPVYVHESCGRGTYRENISLNAAAEGFQVRPGGVVHNNLSMRCPIGMFIGNDSPGVSDVRYNVVIESGDISDIHRRGIGIHVSGTTVVRDNFVGYNTGTGWGTVYGFKIGGGTGDVSNNYVWNWTRDPAMGGPGDVEEGTAFYVDGAAPTMSGNQAFQTRSGIVVGRTGTVSMTGSGNRFYWTPTSRWPAFRPGPTVAGWTGQSNVPVDPRCTIPGIYGWSVETFAAEARKQSKQYWRVELTAADVNYKVRQRINGNGPSTCLANCDGSVIAPVLNINDFICFLNHFMAQSPLANCDGSSGQPMINANDLSCFIDQYASGCN